MLLYKEANSKLEAEIQELLNRPIQSPEAFQESNEDLRRLLSELSARQTSTQNEVSSLRETLQQRLDQHV